MSKSKIGLQQVLTQISELVCLKIDQIVQKLSQNCQKKSQNCPKIVKEMSQNCHLQVFHLKSKIGLQLVLTQMKYN
jgi:hypothetical protein